MPLITRRIALLGAAGVVLTSRMALAAPRINEMAPAFSGIDSDGKPIALADFRGKVVVLEWTNHDCPFVKRHYGSDNMQKLQRRWTEKGVVWLSIISSAAGEQGHVSGDEANTLTKARNAAPSRIIMDTSKQPIARLYDAKTTPEMFVITGEGRIVYMGAIDDKPTTKVSDNDTARNHLDAVLNELFAGKAVSVPVTKPYGCSVKYGA